MTQAFRCQSRLLLGQGNVHVYQRHANELEYKRDAMIIKFQSYIKDTQIRQRNQEWQRSWWIKRGRGTVPITHRTGTREIKGARLTKGVMDQEVGVVGRAVVEFGSWSVVVDTPFIRQAGQLFLPTCNHLSTQLWWKKCLQDITRRSSSGS